MEGEAMNSMDARLAALMALNERLIASVDDLTAELRHTNQVVQQQHVELKLTEQRLDQLSSQVGGTGYSDRMKTVELQVKALFAMSGIIIVSLTAKVLPIVWAAIFGGTGGTP